MKSMIERMRKEEQTRRNEEGLTKREQEKVNTLNKVES